MRIPLHPFLCSMIIAFVLNISVEAAAPPPPKPKQANVGIPDVVTAVGKETITIQNAKVAGYKVTEIDSDGKITRKPPSNIVTYKVDSFTAITVDGLKSKLG